MVHKLKILKGYYDAIKSGEKTFEVRKNDRNYKVGDILELHPYIDGVWQEYSIDAIVTFICDFEQKEGYVVMAIVYDHSANP